MPRQLFPYSGRFVTMSRILLVLLLCCSTAQLDAQNYRSVSWQDIQQLAESEPDTLTIINFWATWCKPCIAEMPYLDALADCINGIPVRVVFVSVDDEQRRATALEPFLERRTLQGEVWSLENGYPYDWIDRIEPEWSGAIPASIFIVGSKKRFFEQELDAAALQQIVNQFIHP